MLPHAQALGLQVISHLQAKLHTPAHTLSRAQGKVLKCNGLRESDRRRDGSALTGSRTVLLLKTCPKFRLKYPNFIYKSSKIVYNFGQKSHRRSRRQSPEPRRCRTGSQKQSTSSSARASIVTIRAFNDAKQRESGCTCLARARRVIHPVPEVSKPVSDVRQQAQRGFEGDRGVLTQPEVTRSCPNEN